ncbi:MAG: hypothetical protein Q7S33_03565 [Nanoarchaeota archaeon]|nr:hypothetical protein [Nanoarchaeota archaeon]
MKNQYILIIDSYDAGNELVRQNLFDLGNKKIITAKTYSEADRIIDLLNNKKREYIAIADSHIFSDCQHTSTSELLKKVVNSGNLAVLHSSEPLISLDNGLKKLIREGMNYVSKSPDSLGDENEFFERILAPLGLERD